MIDLHLSEGDEERRLERYEDLRGRIHLPRVDVRRLATGTAVRMEEPPEPSPVSRELAATVVGRLAALENEWGASLGSDLWLGEVRWDATRSIVSVGRGLLQPSKTTDELQRWCTALGIDGTPQSYADLAALAGQESDTLRPLVGDGSSAEQQVRSFRQLASHQAPAEQMRTLGHAHRFRPTDVTVAAELVTAAIAAGQPGDVPETALHTLRAATSRGAAQLAMARWCRAQGQPQAAMPHALAASKLEPSSRAAWGEVARLAQASGDSSTVLIALDRLAHLGVEGALRQLWTHAGPAHCFPILEAWSHPLSPVFIGLRLEQLHLQERASELLQLFVDNLDVLEAASGIDAGVATQVLDASRRVAGADVKLRMTLHERLLHARPSDALCSLYVRACVAGRVWHPLVELEQLHPNTVPLGLYAQALFEEQQDERLLALDGWEVDPEVASLRLLAMARTTLGGADHAPTMWRTCVAVVGTSEAVTVRTREALADALARAPSLAAQPGLRELLG